MILVNGTKGIGTGFSTDVMCYNPYEIIDYIKTRLETGVFPINTEFIPYYEGYKGTITKIANSKYLIKGKYKVLDYKTIQIV